MSNNRWSLNVPRTEWSVGYEAIILSKLSTEYILIPVAATKVGLPYNPTSDTVQFAFMPTPTQIPASGDWVAGSWDSIPSNIIYPYTAKCLVGPTGTITLGTGTYVIYIKITDSPEVPVLPAGQLVMT
jgi:hypothetical protein